MGIVCLYKAITPSKLLEGCSLDSMIFTLSLTLWWYLIIPSIPSPSGFCSYVCLDDDVNKYF